MDNAFNYAPYMEYLEVLLGRLREEIRGLAAERLPFSENPSVVDDYIYELNSFYYRSFEEKIFPYYRRRIQEDLTALLNLSLQEDTLKKGILNSIKRYAQLYNQVKKLIGALNAGKETTCEHLLQITREEDQHTIELSSLLKEWRGRLQATALLIHSYSNLADDKELLSRLNRSPLYSLALQYLGSINMDNPLNAAVFNTIIANLRITQNQVAQLQKEDRPPGKGASPFKNLLEKTSELAGKKPPATFGQLSLFLTEQIKSKLQILELYWRHNEHPLMASTLRQLGIFLEDLVVVLEKGRHYLISGHKEALLQLVRGGDFPELLIDDIKAKLGTTMNDLDQLIAQYNAGSAPDLNHFSAQTRVLLEQAQGWMGVFGENRTLIQPGILTSSIYHSLLELQYLILILDLIEEESRGKASIRDAYLAFLNNLDFFLNLLSNIRADLERLLASRNLGRLWKDLEISVDRIPLEKGKLFPSQYISLLNNSNVQEKWGEYEDRLILYEEGDLFIIRVEGEYAHEIPGLIIGRKK